MQLLRSAAGGIRVQPQPRQRRRLVMNWYPQPIGELDSPRVRRLTDSCGAEGAGVWLAAKCELYRAAAAEGLELTFDELSRAVSRDLGISRKKSQSVLETAAKCGVFEVKNDEKRTVSGYGFQQEVERYNSISYQRKRAANARWWNDKV